MAKLRALPISTWSYLDEPATVHHLGPPEANRRHLERELEQIEVVPLTLGGAGQFRHVKAGLRAKGIYKPDLDLMIAATALDLGATLVTNGGC